MIVSENITTYVHSLEKPAGYFLEHLRQKAEGSGVPIIRREMESFIKVLLAIHRPATILEIGTAVGYSAIFMGLNSGARITTIENYEPRIIEARKNLHMAEKEYPDLTGRIQMIAGNAEEVLKELVVPVDFIFLDAAKGQYITMLPDILRLLPSGGVLLSDNILQDGALVRSRYATPRRQRTIHERMREYVWEVKHNEQLETTLITIGDGVTLSIKK